MHRLPLKLNEASYTWDRGLPDFLLFERALNTENVKDMVNYLELIEIEVDAYNGFRKIAAINDYNDALNMLLRQDETSALVVFDKIILHAPRDGLALPLSLRVRGNIYYKHNRFDGAANDFEFLLHLTDNTADNILEIFGKLVVCFYMLGKYDKAKEAYEMYNRHLPKPSRRKAKGGRISSLDADIEMLTSTVQKLFFEIEHQHPTPEPIKREAQQGSLFWSLLCTDNNTGDRQNRLYSKTNLPSNAVVLSEKPIARTICMPWVQCDYCLELSEHMYSCFDCRLKTYCCMNCLKSDTMHTEECKGTKYLTVLMLNSQQLYRAFIEAIYHIKRHIIGHKGLTRLKKAGDILTAIRTYAKDFSIPMLKLIGEECDYRDMSDMQFSTVIATTLRLSIFIAEKTNLIEELRPAINITHKQELIIVGSLLMQLQYHLQKGSYLLSFDLPFRKPKILENTLKIEERMKDLGIRIFPKKGAQNASEFFYLNQEILSLKVSTYMAVEIETTTKTPLPDEIEEPTASLSEDLVMPVLEYCDYVAKLVLQDEFIDDADGNGSTLSQHIARMDFTRREVFLESYFREYNRNVFNFFLKKRTIQDDKAPKQIIMLLGRELQKFRHSCDPNVEVIFLTNGMIIGKTLKPLMKGEECFISYRSRYFNHNHETRKDILKRYNVQCDCQYCRMPERNEPFAIHSNIYCVPSCKTEFGFVDDVCPKCGRDYTTLLQEYAKRIAELESACSADDDERELHKHWIVLDRVAELLFPPYHEYRVMQRLKYAKFIAMNNFVGQAFDLTRKIYLDIKKYYPEESILFTYYPTVLEILTLLQYYNIDQGLDTAPLAKLKEMNRLGLALIHAQLTHVKIYEKFDQNCGTILADYRLFCGWKERMLLMDIDIPALELFVRDETRTPGLQSRAA